MLDVMSKMYSGQYSDWLGQLLGVIPGLGKKLNSDPKLAKKILAETARSLKLKA
jgi:phage shock protein PspC (stress-responsive transcriptional regulator)